MSYGIGPRPPYRPEPVDKDEHCDCACHKQGCSSRECPECYFADGFFDDHAKKRWDDHKAKYPGRSW